MQWNVFRARLDPTVGREQAGERPVVVISAEPLNEHYDVVTVVPITSRKGGRPARLGEVLLPTDTAGLPLESFALCYQIRTLDRSRLGQRYGEIEEPALRLAIMRAVAECLDIVASDLEATASSDD